MTELRKRMIESLQLRGFSRRTQEMYVRAVRLLAEHYHKPPDLITEEELRQYFLYVMNVKKWSRAASTISICGIKFFFQQTLNPTKSDSTEAATEESRVDDELRIENEAPIENRPSVECERTQVEPYSDAPRCPLCGTVLIRGRRIEAVPRGERRPRIPPSAFITQAGRSPP
jgi:hypothetical protein